MIYRFFGSMTLLASFAAIAVEHQPKTIGHGPTDQPAEQKMACPNESGLNAICSFVRDKSSDPTGVEKYRYQSVIKKGACSKSTDTKEQEAAKVRLYWEHYQDRLVCNDISFTIRNGSIIKYAISKTNDQFVYDVAKKWGVNLNKVDDHDGQTALDFAEKVLATERSAGSSLIPKIEMYVKFLRQSGAKRASEL